MSKIVITFILVAFGSCINICYSVDEMVAFVDSISIRVILKDSGPKNTKVRIAFPKLQQLPEYPFGMRAQGVTGEADVRIILDLTGHVVDCCILKASQPEFGSAVLAAAKKWEFSPTLNSAAQPIPGELTYRIFFEKADD